MGSENNKDIGATLAGRHRFYNKRSTYSDRERDMDRRRRNKFAKLVEKESDTPDGLPEDYFQPDSEAVYKKAERFPLAQPALSVIDLEVMTETEFVVWQKRILKACMKEPGAFVLGATDFLPQDPEPEDAICFLVAAGFSRDMAERIACPGWTQLFLNPNGKTPTKLPYHAPESSVSCCGPRGHEAAIQSGGALS